MDFTVREYRPEDFEVLWSIDQHCFAPGVAYSRRELSTYIHKRGAFTILAQAHDRDSAEFQGIIAFIVAESNRRGLGHIITIDVLPKYRRFGLGSKLLSGAENRLAHGSCHSVRLETAVDNASAIAFYKRHNYSIMSTIPRYYPGGVNAFVFQKDLASEAAKAVQAG